MIAAAVLILAAGCTAAVPVIEARSSLDGRRLELLLDACNAETELRVDESANDVAVQVRRHRVIVASGACQDAAYVNLERPLDSRPIIDRSDDRRVPVSTPQPVWPYDRERVTPAEYGAALEAVVHCLERRDPEITAKVVPGLNYPSYDWTKPADEQGVVEDEANAIEVCEREHLDPLA